MTLSPRQHAAAGGLALLMICTFWTSTVIVEWVGTPAQIAHVKTAVLWAMPVLIPSLALAGASGSALAKGWRSPQVQTKRRRMRIAAANGLLILLPSAAFLAFRARSEALDPMFYSVQALELAAGALNIALLSLNMRDGLALARRRAGRVA